MRLLFVRRARLTVMFAGRTLRIVLSISICIQVSIYEYVCILVPVYKIVCIALYSLVRLPADVTASASAAVSLWITCTLDPIPRLSLFLLAVRDAPANNWTDMEKCMIGKRDAFLPTRGVDPVIYTNGR